MKAAVTNAPTRRDAKRAEERTAILFTLVEEQQLPNAPKNTQKQEKTPHYLPGNPSSLHRAGLPVAPAAAALSSNSRSI